MTIRAKLSLGAISAINKTVFKLTPPQVLFHIQFIGGASVVFPQCYMLLCLCVCSVLFNFKMFLFKLFCVSNSFVSAMVNELPPVLERAANSAYHL